MGIDAQMFIKIKQEHPPEHEELEEWGSDLIRDTGLQDFPFGGEGMMVLGLSSAYDHGKTPGGRVYVQDGPFIEAGKGEWFVEVGLLCRYWSPSYPRGPIRELVAIAEWLETNLCGEVWYGGDSSGVVARRWTREKRQEYLKHYESISEEEA